MRYLLLVLASVCGLAQAEIYKTYDKNGNVVFTDTPSAAAEQVQEKPIMTMPALSRDVIDKKQKDKPAPASTEPTAYKVAVDRPKANDMLHKTEASFNAVVSLTPPLWKEHHLHVTLDGKSQGIDNFAPTIDPVVLERGQHRLEIKAVDAKGRELGKEVIDFFIQQPSAIKPAKKP